MMMGFLSIVSKALIICFSMIGLYYSSKLNEKTFKKASFIYYTNLNLVFCLIYFIFSIFINDNKLLNDVNGFILLSSIVTITVYQFVLVPNHQKMGENYELFSLTDIAVHYIVPLLVILNWLIFAAKGQFSYYYPFLWVIPFLIYFLAIMIRAHYSGLIETSKSRYPYYFIDLDEVSVKKALQNLTVLSLMIVVFGYVLVFLDLFLK
ncbi:MAG: Pr6Pr family membrane protein [Methanobrevibacter sp.]|nr:Pr6Pr family membrane protein [Methanobrevibacter sp.]